MEGYLRRGIVKLSDDQPRGKGHHRRYTGREAAKIYSVFLMSKAGVAPASISSLVNESPKYRDHYEMPKEQQERLFDLFKEKGIPIPLPLTADQKAAREPAWIDLIIDDFIQNGEESKYANASPVVCNPSGHYGITTGKMNVLFADRESLVAQMREDNTLTYVVVDLYQIVHDVFNGSLLEVWQQSQEN
ncbi:MAG: hypothetical protein HY820_23415 [Acidobacteria bacterium]|nr:hypothetical protein [Acidobacteriota bacterium]